MQRNLTFLSWCPLKVESKQFRVCWRAFGLSMGSWELRSGTPALRVSQLLFVYHSITAWLFLHRGKHFNTQKRVTRRGDGIKPRPEELNDKAEGDKKREKNPRRASKTGLPKLDGK